MYKLFKLNSITDAKGSLMPIEIAKLDLFEVKRIYMVYQNKTMRGGHAHIIEEEFFFMAQGSCTAKLHDKKDWINIELKVSDMGLYVGKLIWHQFENFSDDAVLMALSSTTYNPSREDYIENFNQYLNV